MPPSNAVPVISVMGRGERENCVYESTRNRQHSGQQREKEAQTHKHRKANRRQRRASLLSRVPFAPYIAKCHSKISSSSGSAHVARFVIHHHRPVLLLLLVVVGSIFHLPFALERFILPLERCVERRCSRRRI